MTTRELVINCVNGSHEMQPSDTAGQPPIRGPYCHVKVAGNTATVPWYMILFDNDGQCTSTETLSDLLKDVKDNHYTDIFLFSHGWNNSLPDALDCYRRFIAGYACMDKTGLELKRDFKPLLVGVYWPSAILVMPWERGPQIAAGEASTGVGLMEGEIELLAGTLGELDATQLRELAARKDNLTAADVLDLARILAPLYEEKTQPDMPVGNAAPSPEELVDAWRKSSERQQVSANSGQGRLIQTGQAGGTGGLIGGQRGAGSKDQLQAAGFSPLGIIRNGIRATTVFLMKDRAGRVGAHGVSDLLSELLDIDSAARMHLTGHSYGCKVLLSALCFPQTLPRQVNSVLLLQPAISYLAFAPVVADTGKPGGYRAALDRVEQPIMTTYSSEDKQLHDLFHLAVKRAADLGELQIAGGEGAPNKYAALGGYGPGGLGTASVTFDIHAHGQPYPFPVAAGPGTQSAPKVFALQGAGAIHGHSGISNLYTYWALYNQVVG